MLARLFVLVGGLIVLALTAALVGPYLIDWTSYRSSFEREASAILGRKVTVEGAAKARLLPFPSVTFSDVSVAGGPDGTPAMTVETFSMDAELAPLMRGEFLIFDMRLVRPKATIGIGADGVVDWAMRPSSPFDPGQIAVEKLTVTEGEVTLRHAAGGRDHVLSDINTVISARSLAGPWRAAGSLRLDGMETRVEISTGKLYETRAMRLRVRADPAIYPLAVEMDGDVRLEDGAALYAGAFKVDAKVDSRGDAATTQLRGTDGASFKQQETSGREPPPYRLSGKFAVDHQRLDVEQFRFETGPLDNPYTADGTGLVDLGTAPHFEIEAHGAQVRFDETVAEPGKASGATLATRLAGLERMLAGLPRPGIPGTVDLALPAVVAGDTTVRDVRIAAEPASEGWNIKALSAALPGRTTLEASGLLRTPKDFGFQGSLLLAVGQPSGFAAWLSRDVDEAIRRLPAAGFKASVDLTRERQAFHDLELILGKARFRGEVDSRQPQDAEPSMALKLEGDALDIDGMTAFASLFVSGRGLTELAARNLDLAIRAGPVSAGGLTAETVDAALRLRGEQLEIDRLSIGGLEGSTVSATGTLRDIASNPSGRLDASIVAVDLTPLLKLVSGQYPGNLLFSALAERAAAYPGLLEDAQIDLVGTAAPNGDGTSGFAVSANGDAGGSTFSLAASGMLAGGTALDIDPAAPLSISFSARNDNAEALMALHGLPVLPLGAVGGGDATLTAKGTLEKGLETSFDFTATDMTAAFNGSLRMAEGQMKGEGDVTLEATDIEPWLMTSGMMLPGMGLGLPVELAAKASFGDGTLRMSGLSGTVGGGRLSGDVAAAVRDGVPHLTGTVSAEALDLWPAVATVLGEASIQGAGGAWPDVAFRNKVATPFTAELDIKAGSVSAGMFGTAADVSATARLDMEGLHISNLDAKAYGGVLSGLGELKNNDGTALFSGQMKLTGADLAALLDGSGLAGKGDVTATLSASGKSVEAMVAALSGSGTVTFGGTTVPGVNPNAFAALIRAADAVGREIGATDIAAFAPDIVGDGTFQADGGEIAFTVASGILRAPPLTLAGQGVSLTAELKADANTGTVSATGQIAYAPGDEALAGSEPVVGYAIEGPLQTAQGRLDLTPLTQFLTQRALEIEQARVEAMQAQLLERQRLRREVRYYAALQSERDRLVEEKRRAEEEARKRAEEEARRKAEEEARRKAEAEARARADAEAKAAAEAKARADEAARQKAFEERAAEAIRMAEQERAQHEAEAKKPEIERAPLPAIEGGGAGRINPSSIDDFLRSLQGPE
ncbi:AsmA family protein [Mesorhizobium sp. L-8-3]|uniref:AsmA family protein n=1 Tax=Mesorhizobium sp. L-8-3 TaxID=2744522 RepID=UPI001927328A|nr:AsmA-like C-terminal region-containing protein [Mesorhizobium sp. L-8-3]BCH24180.1 hypothetical protein MesoLjLb_39650 [Mesorhizobium sp. L-8-3]